jgi:DNA-directed RNA polymerase-3 subunit RPC5
MGKSRRPTDKLEQEILDLEDPNLISSILNNNNGSSKPSISETEDMELCDSIDEEKDEIVREIDVFISPELAQSMHLIQFPLTPASNTGPNRKINKSKPIVPKSARMKPQHANLELEFEIPSTTFSRQRQIPGSLDLNTRTFSSHNIPLTTHMAMGVFDSTGSRIDLIPLHRIMQMRPSFKHIDDLYDDDEDDDILDEEDKKESKPIMFKKQENERALLSRQSSYAYKKACEGEQDWVDLNVYDDKSKEYNIEYKKVHCSQAMRDKTLRFVKAGKVGGNIGYVRSLNYLPGVVNKDDTEDFIPNMDPKYSDEWMKELTTRVANLLQAKQGLPISFSVIRSRFNKAISDQALIQALSASAALVRGNFVLKSSMMGLSKPIANARDVILILLNKYGIIRRDILEKVYGQCDDLSALVTIDVINALLAMLARQTKNGMEMKLDDDLTLEEQFTEVSRLHEVYWQKREDELEKYIQDYTQLSEINK